MRSKGYRLLGIKRVCEICGTYDTYVNKLGYQYWHTYRGKRYCSRCYAKLVSNPKGKEKRRDIKARTYVFIDRRIVEDRKTRNGMCSKCGKKIGDKYRGWRNKEITAKQTQLHHRFYLTICPWFSRTELCVACHDKIRWQEWKEKQKNIPKPILFCSLCGSKYSISKYWYYDKGNRLCRRCWRNTVYGPANRERINMLARINDAKRKAKTRKGL